MKNLNFCCTWYHFLPTVLSPTILPFACSAFDLTVLLQMNPCGFLRCYWQQATYPPPLPEIILPVRGCSNLFLGCFSARLQMIGMGDPICHKGGSASRRVSRKLRVPLSSPSLLKPSRGGGLGSSDVALPGILDIECFQLLIYLPKLTAAPPALLFVLFTIILTQSYQNYKQSLMYLLILPYSQGREVSTLSLWTTPSHAARI